MKTNSATNNPDRFFSIKHLTADLNGQSVRGSAVTVAAEALKFCLHTGSLVVLSRLLSPEDYGLIGMVNVVLVFMTLFKDLGLSTATIQASEINHKQVSTLFWINVAIGCFIATTIAVLAPAIALFYDEPRVTRIALALGSGFILSGLTAQHDALLRRQMHFASLAKIQIISMLAGLITAIVSAFYGIGYWALVLMQLMSGFVNAVGVWVACGWRPGLPRWNSGISSMLAFGGNVTGFYFFDYFSRNLDNILIGQYWGPQQLGLYVKAYQLLMLPIQQFTGPVTRVALPALSLLSDRPEQYRAYYYKAVLCIATLGMPLVTFMFASADKVILIVLGEQWLNTIPIFQCLAPAAFLGTFTWTGWIYQSLGRTDRLLRWGIISSAIDTIAFLIGIHWGTTGVAIAFSLSQLILLVPTFTYCFKGTSIQLSEIAITLSRPAFASLVAGMALIGTNRLLPNVTSVTLHLILDCVLYSLVYLVMWLIIPGGKRTLLEMIYLIKKLKK